MVEILEESIVEKEIGIKTNEPLTIVYKILNSSSNFGNIVKKDDKMYSSKTGYIINHFIELIKDLDGISCIIFSIYIDVEETYVKIIFKISLKAELRSYENIFNEYYKNYIYPKLIKKAKKISEKYISRIQEIAKAYSQI
jgi:hypothetical protein